MKIRNTNPLYGDAGPFECQSKEAMADEMKDHFLNWARERYDMIPDPGVGRVVFVHKEVLRMTQEFIAGLEVV